MINDGWKLSGLCREVDPDLHHMDRGYSSTEAKRVCAGCEVRAACLDHALLYETRGHDAWGIWGGLTVNERRRELRRRAGQPSRPRKDTAA